MLWFNRHNTYVIRVPVVCVLFDCNGVKILTASTTTMTECRLYFQAATLLQLLYNRHSECAGVCNTTHY